MENDLLQFMAFFEEYTGNRQYQEEMLEVIRDHGVRFYLRGASVSSNQGLNFSAKLLIKLWDIEPETVQKGIQQNLVVALAGIADLRAPPRGAPYLNSSAPA